MMSGETEAVPTSVTVADGTEARVGAVLYGEDGRPWRIVGIDPWRRVRPVLARSNDCERLFRELRPEWLRAEPPDTMDRLCALAERDPYEYWGCVGEGCEWCPAAMKRGTRPYRAYSCGDCETAMRLDLAHRAYEVGRRGDAPSPAPDWRAEVARDG